MVGLLDLIAVFDALAEHAVGVAEAVADHRQPQGGATIHEAGRQPPQAAVAQTGVVLALGQFLQRQPHFVQRLVDRFGDAQIEHGVAQRPAHQEFQGQVIGPAHAAVGLVSVAGVLPALPQPVAQGEHQGFVHVVGVFGMPVAAQSVAEVVSEVGGDAFGVHAQGRQFRQPGCWRASFYGLDCHGGKVRCMCLWDGKHPAPGRMASEVLGWFESPQPAARGLSFAEHHRNDSRAISNCKALSMPSGEHWRRWISGHGQARARRRIAEIMGTIDGGLAERSSG